MGRTSPLVRSPSAFAAASLASVLAAALLQAVAIRPALSERPETRSRPPGPGYKAQGTQFIAPEIFEQLDERFAKHTEDENRDALISLAKDLYTTADGQKTSFETAVDDVRGLNPLLRSTEHDAEAAEKAADVLARDGIRAMHRGSARNQGTLDLAADILKQGHKSVFDGVTRHEGHLFAKQGYTSNVHGQDDAMPHGTSANKYESVSTAARTDTSPDEHYRQLMDGAEVKDATGGVDVANKRIEDASEHDEEQQVDASPKLLMDGTSQKPDPSAEKRIEDTLELGEQNEDASPPATVPEKQDASPTATGLEDASPPATGPEQLDASTPATGPKKLEGTEKEEEEEGSEIA